MLRIFLFLKLSNFNANLLHVGNTLFLLRFAISRKIVTFKIFLLVTLYLLSNSRFFRLFVMQLIAHLFGFDMQRCYEFEFELQKICTFYYE